MNDEFLTRFRKMPRGEFADLRRRRTCQYAASFNTARHSCNLCHIGRWFD